MLFNGPRQQVGHQPAAGTITARYVFYLMGGGRDLQTSPLFLTMKGNSSGLEIK